MSRPSEFNKYALIFIIAAIGVFAGCKEDSKLTLKQVMSGLGNELGTLIGASLKGDLLKAETSARAIAEHAKPMKAQRKIIIEYLGEERAEIFRTYDANVHIAASRAAEAASAGDLQSLTDGVLEIQRGCYTCHREFQKEISELLAPSSAEQGPNQAQPVETPEN